MHKFFNFVIKFEKILLNYVDLQNISLTKLVYYKR